MFLIRKNVVLFVINLIISILVLIKSNKKVVPVITLVLSSILTFIYLMLTLIYFLIFFDRPDNNNNVDNLILSNECFRYTEEGAIIENYCDCKIEIAGEYTDGDRFPTSKYTILVAEDFATISNLNFDIIVYELVQTNNPISKLFGKYLFEYLRFKYLFLNEFILLLLL